MFLLKFLMDINTLCPDINMTFRDYASNKIILYISKQSKMC